MTMKNLMRTNVKRRIIEALLDDFNNGGHGLNARQILAVTKLDNKYHSTFMTLSILCKDGYISHKGERCHYLYFITAKGIALLDYYFTHKICRCMDTNKLEVKCVN